MKAGREHPVPLSERAAAILRQPAEITGDFAFLGQHKDGPLSDRTMRMTLRRMKIDTVTVHGFQSSFRNWAGNETHYSRDPIETALAHAIGDKAEQAYRRSDEKRRKLMEAWASYCEPKANSNVLHFGRAYFAPSNPDDD
jgi:integrase